MITDIVIVIAAALFIGVYVSWRAGRIDRLHARVDMARAALDATLLRRSSVALEFASSGLLDPAASLLVRLIRHEPAATGIAPEPGPMPDKRKKISDADIAVVERWVKAGAIMPPDAPKP